jgi:hypothetical protein
MAHESIKSPLLWSIGGVGLVAGSVIAFSYWSHSQTILSTTPSAVTVASASSPEIFTPTATEPWERALEFGWEAAVATQTAATEMDWRRVGDLWLQAIAELDQVSPDSPRRAEAQAKIQQYLANFEYAEAAKNKARTPIPSAAGGPAAEALKASLAHGPLWMTFSNGEAAGKGYKITGQSANGQIRMELMGSAENLTQMKLIFPKVQGSHPVTMAHIVYTNQFLKAAVPHYALQPNWLAQGMKQLQSAPQKPVTQAVGAYRISLSRNPQAGEMVVTVSSKP